MKYKYLALIIHGIQQQISKSAINYPPKMNLKEKILNSIYQIQERMKLRKNLKLEETNPQLDNQNFQTEKFNKLMRCISDRSNLPAREKEKGENNLGDRENSRD